MKVFGMKPLKAVYEMTWLVFTWKFCLWLMLDVALGNI